MTKHSPESVKRSRGVQPVEVTHKPLIAEHELLPSSPNGHAAFLDTADVDVREAQIELIAERRTGNRSVSAFDTRVLCLNRR